MRWLPSTLPLLLLACSGVPVDPCGDPCLLQDAWNFRYQSELDIELHERAAGADIAIEWSGLRTGLQNNIIDPEQDIDQLVLVVFSELSPVQVREGIATDTLQQADVRVYMLCTPGEGETRCVLSEFGLLGSYPGMDEYFVEDSGTWLVALQGDQLTGAQALIFMRPVEGAGESPIHVDDQSTQVCTEVDLESQDPVGLPSASRGGVLDWSELSTDGYGNPMALHTLSQLQIARYDESLAEIETRFVELDSLAEETWTADIEGRTELSFSELEGEREYPGIDGDSRWLLALSCGSCDTPVPRVLIVLTPGG
jgi:hypothetical protein